MPHSCSQDHDQALLSTFWVGWVVQMSIVLPMVLRGHAGLASVIHFINQYVDSPSGAASGSHYVMPSRKTQQHISTNAKPEFPLYTKLGSTAMSLAHELQITRWTLLANNLGGRSPTYIHPGFSKKMLRAEEFGHRTTSSPQPRSWFRWSPCCTPSKTFIRMASTSIPPLQLSFVQFGQSSHIASQSN